MAYDVAEGCLLPAGVAELDSAAGHVRLCARQRVMVSADSLEWLSRWAAGSPGREDPGLSIRLIVQSYKLHWPGLKLQPSLEQLLLR